MGETKKKPVSLQEKIDVFTRYFAEENESINGKTVFEGHPIGEWAIQIRSDINNKRGNIKPDLKQLKQLFKLGILESQRDSTIDEKIDALVQWTDKHPDIVIESRNQETISYATLNQLEELAARENIPYDEILKRYEKLQGYREYVWHRDSKNKLTKAQRTKCKEGGLRGRFGLPSVIEDMAAKYNIDNELAEYIHKNYGSVEEIINKYRTGELSEEETYRFVGTLITPWIDIDNSPNRKAYEEFILALSRDEIY